MIWGNWGLCDLFFGGVEICVLKCGCCKFVGLKCLCVCVCVCVETVLEMCLLKFVLEMCVCVETVLKCAF